MLSIRSAGAHIYLARSQGAHTCALVCSAQVRFAEQLSKQQRLASDAVGARAEVSALKAEMSQLKNNEMMQR